MLTFPFTKTGLLLLTLVITGCSTVTYEEPKSGPTARVRFVTETSDVAVVRGYKSTKCEGEYEMMRLRNGFLLNSSPKRMGIPLWDYHKNAAKEFFIPASTPQIFMLEGSKTIGNRINRCATFVRQTFEEGKDYEIKLHDAFNCKVIVSEIQTNTSGNVEKILLQKKDNRLSPDFTDSCLEKFHQRRLY